MCVLTLKSSHRLDGKNLDAFASTLTCRRYVSQMKTSHRPDGKIAHTLALILACATATDASVNYRRCVPQRPSKVPIAPMEIPADLPNRLSSFNSDRYLDLSGICTCQPHLQTSHRPDGIFTCLVLCACRVAVCTSTEAR